MTIRKAAVAGAFYPADANEIKEMFSHYSKIVDKHIMNGNILNLKPKALIVPHAGYIYSAFTANIAMRLLQNSQPKCVVVIGPSHRVYLKGSSISDYNSYETPLGMLPINRALVTELKEKFGLVCIPEVHHEHSTEVQMPFIKTYDEEASVVEIVYGDENPQRLAKIIEYLLDDPDNAVVISTDLSHYHDIKKANELDNICLDAIKSLDPSKLHQGCEACGRVGVESMLIAAKNRDLTSIILDYRTSADASGDEKHVVGYISAVFI